jgi:hypothetical protein
VVLALQQDRRRHHQQQQEVLHRQGPRLQVRPLHQRLGGSHLQALVRPPLALGFPTCPTRFLPQPRGGKSVKQ